MTSNQPYLLKAFFDWILDNGLTPFIVVNAQLPGVVVPTQFVKDGQIVLNISPSACVNFHMDLEHISFQARFSGQPMLVTLPNEAVGAIYAKENGAGTVFADAEELQQALLAKENKDHETGAKVTLPAKKGPSLSSVSNSQNTQKSDGAESKVTDKATDDKKRPSLKIIK